MVEKQQPITKAGLKKIEKELSTWRRCAAARWPTRSTRPTSWPARRTTPSTRTPRTNRRWSKGRIAQLQSLITNATIIDEAGAHKSKLVMLGSNVKVRSEGKSQEYTIVGPAEADPRDGKISNESPVGRALMGKKLNDEVQVSVPKGIITMKITKIS